MSESTRDTLSRVTSLAIMIAILVVAAGVSAITAMRWAIQGKEVTVPVLTGKSEAEAAAILETSKLVLRVSGNKRFSRDVPALKIVEQFPPGGTHLKTSRTVTVLLSAGDRSYAVPNLVGSSVRAAKLTLEQRSFTLGNTSMTRTASGEPLTVQQQDPQPGSQGGTDPTVNVLVSSGRIEESFVMPDVVGKRLDQVASRIRAEGFQIGKLSYRKSSGADVGVIVQQQPQAGHRVLKTDPIVLEVNQ
ncbi:MAG TPA: PASTA domain-containing protein [Terriglobia bacterium]|nr:PASTA domain-containing protein [Terriglobia bacterium]HVQ63811.1 PASTA domain-containing protein [Terriglobia bacterium]